MKGGKRKKWWANIDGKDFYVGIFGGKNRARVEAALIAKRMWAFEDLSLKEIQSRIVLDNLGKGRQAKRLRRKSRPRGAWF